MSTENNANEQNVVKRRGPDLRFVWGIVAVVILGGLFYGGFVKYKELSDKLDNSVSKEEYNQLVKSETDLKNKLGDVKAGLETQVVELNKQISQRINDNQTKIDSLNTKNNNLVERLDFLESQPGRRMYKTINDVVFIFRWCPPGEFMMGSPESEAGRNPDTDQPQHSVSIDQGFWIAQTEITQLQWKAIMGNNPSSNFDINNPLKTVYRPVENVSWNDCQEFCKKCTDLGMPVKLPSEAQWEYACRAGKTNVRFGGELSNVAWYKFSGDGKETHNVGTKMPNDWDIYDMHGNVWEWCEDSSGDSRRIFRGGAFASEDFDCRSARRRDEAPTFKTLDVGFRVVFIPQPLNQNAGSLNRF